MVGLFLPDDIVLVVSFGLSLAPSPPTIFLECVAECVAACVAGFDFGCAGLGRCFPHITHFAFVAVFKKVQAPQAHCTTVEFVISCGLRVARVRVRVRVRILK